MTAPEDQKPEETAAAPAPSELLQKVLARLGPLVLEHRSFRGDDRIHVARENIVEVARLLRNSPELGFDLLLDVTAVDYFGQPDDFRNAPEVWDRKGNLVRRRNQWRHRVNLPERGNEPRFAVVYHFVSTRFVHRIRVKCRVPEDDPTIATLSGLWPGANWLERETFDLCGIRFAGHPDLRRIYLYDEFVGHPLRKDYAKHDEQPIEPYTGPGANEPRRPHPVIATSAPFRSTAPPLPPALRNPASLEAPAATNGADALDAPLMRLQFGPSHPATHGTVKMVLDLDGERVARADIEVGFLHRGFEKECESGYYYQNIPYTDRLNYSSAMLNNVGYCMAVEKLMELKTPPRCDYIRVIAGEISRIADHCLCIGAMALELAAMTPFLYVLESREVMLDLLDALCGARVTTNYIRIGGVSADLPEGFPRFAVERLDIAIKLLEDCDKLLAKNPVFRERVEGVGHMTAEELIGHGVTGPLLRAGGVPYDIRRVQPYLVYGELDFDVPVGEHSDNYDRYLVRIEEIRQSRRMILQCFDKVPDGPVNCDDPRVRWPRKGKVFGRMEELIDQFKLVTEGAMVPPGEVYHAVEAANGELGFYLVSDGTGKPYKCRCRSPSFSNMSALEKMITGRLLADVVPTFDLINMIGGECDR